MTPVSCVPYHTRISQMHDSKIARGDGRRRTPELLLPCLAVQRAPRGPRCKPYSNRQDSTELELRHQPRSREIKILNPKGGRRGGKERMRQRENMGPRGRWKHHLINHHIKQNLHWGQQTFSGKGSESKWVRAFWATEDFCHILLGFFFHTPLKM